MSIFLNYDGVKGETSDTGHKDWIDVISWQWGTERKSRLRLQQKAIENLATPRLQTF